MAAKPADHAICTVHDQKVDSVIITNKDQSVVDNILAKEFTGAPITPNTADAIKKAEVCTPADIQNGVYRFREFKTAPSPKPGM